MKIIKITKRYNIWDTIKMEAYNSYRSKVKAAKVNNRMIWMNRMRITKLSDKMTRTNPNSWVADKIGFILT